MHSRGRTEKGAEFSGMPDKYVDDYWRMMVSATPEEKQRGQARQDAIDHLRRATAALSAAQAGERETIRLALLSRTHATLAQAQRDLEALR
jgi:hypothetical protein